MSVLLAMTGQAEVDVDIESIDVDLVDCEGGLRYVWHILDTRYGDLDGKLLDDAGEDFLRCKRMDAEDMEPYITRMKKRRARLTQVDPTMTVSDRFFAWYLLRQAKLSYDERTRVMTITGWS